MTKLRLSDRRFLEDVFEMGSGYVLNFTDRTFAEFFENELSVNIDDPKYRLKGTSKGKRLRTFLEIESEPVVAKALRVLWEYRDSFREPTEEQKETARQQKDRFFGIVHSIEGAISTARTDAIEKFAENQTLEELISAIERDTQANKPEAALDRLHTYCMKKFAFVLDQKGIAFDKRRSPAEPGREIHQGPGERRSDPRYLSQDTEELDQHLRQFQ
jgi:hypothetical protein